MILLCAFPSMLVGFFHVTEDMIAATMIEKSENIIYGQKHIYF